MKIKNYLFAILFIGFSLSIQAQSSTEPSISKGIKAGWHYANMYRSGSAPFENLSTFYVGVFSEGYISSNVKIGSGLDYFQNGFNSNDGSFRMHTLSLPAYGKIYVGPLYGMAGLAFNFKLTDNREDFPGGVQSETKITDTKFFDLPLSLGLGVEIARFQIEAKYNWGLFNAAYIDGYGYKNQYFQVGAAFLF